MCTNKNILVILNSKERTSGYQRHNPDASRRPSFYMSEDLLREIEAQAQQEHASRSGFVTSILTFLLLSPIGQQLRQNASLSNRTIVQELEQSLALFQQQLPLQQINQLAVATQRSQAQMLIHLVLLGLQAYQVGEHSNHET
jgi:hypothetical protein